MLIAENRSVVIRPAHLKDQLGRGLVTRERYWSGKTNYDSISPFLIGDYNKGEVRGEWQEIDMRNIKETKSSGLVIKESYRGVRVNWKFPG